MPATGGSGVMDLVPATGVRPGVWVPQACGTKTSGVSVLVTGSGRGLGLPLGLEWCVSPKPSDSYWIKMGEAARAIVRKEEWSLLEEELKYFVFFAP